MGSQPKCGPLLGHGVSGNLAVCSQTQPHLQSPVPSLVLRPLDTSATPDLITLKHWLVFMSLVNSDCLPQPPDSCQKGPKRRVIWVSRALQLGLPLMVVSSPALPHLGKPCVDWRYRWLLKKAQLELARCHVRHVQQGYHPGHFKALSEHTEKRGIQTLPRSGAEGTRTIAIGFLVAKLKQEIW